MGSCGAATRASLGIGTPSAAASGVIAANTIVNVDQHIAMLEETAKKDPLYKFLSPGPFQWLYRGIVSGMTPSPELRGAARSSRRREARWPAEKGMAASR